MRRELSDGKFVWWRSDTCYKRIVGTADCRKSDREEDSEPGPVAYFRDGTYIALWNTETTDVLIISLDTAVWPE